MLLTYILNDFEIVPVAPIITGITGIIIIIIIIIELITLLIIYLLGVLHLSQPVGGIRLSQGKEIHPIP